MDRPTKFAHSVQTYPAPSLGQHTLLCMGMRYEHRRHEILLIDGHLHACVSSELFAPQGQDVAHSPYRLVLDSEALARNSKL